VFLCRISDYDAGFVSDTAENECIQTGTVFDLIFEMDSFGGWSSDFDIAMDAGKYMEADM
jgi:hypothetical protein